MVRRVLMTFWATGANASSPTAAQIIVIASMTCPRNCLYSIELNSYKAPSKKVSDSSKYWLKSVPTCSTTVARAVAAFSLVIEMPSLIIVQNF